MGVQSEQEETPTECARHSPYSEDRIGKDWSRRTLFINNPSRTAVCSASATPKDQRRFSNVLTELPGECALVVEAVLLGDFCHRPIRLEQGIAGCLNACADDEFLRTHSEGVLKAAVELAF